MSKMKKLLACLLAAAMVTTSVVPVFATSTTAPVDSTQTGVTTQGDQTDVTVGAESSTLPNKPDSAVVDTAKDGTAALKTVQSAKEKVAIAETVKVNGIDYTVTALGVKAFSACKTAKRIVVNVSSKAKEYTIAKNAFGKHSKGKTLILKRVGSKNKHFTKKQQKKLRNMLKAAGFKGKIKFR